MQTQEECENRTFDGYSVALKDLHVYFYNTNWENYLKGEILSFRKYYQLVIQREEELDPLPFTEPETPPDPMCVIYQTTEDDADDTIVPRFIRANGDREKLIFINEKEAPISFDDARIEAAIKTTGAKLLILDPLSSYIGDCQLNAANEVRPRFNHLNKMFGTKAI